MADILSLGTLLYIFSFILFLSRLNKSKEVSYYWVFALFISAAVVWSGFYFSIFPFQAGISSGNLSNQSILNTSQTSVLIINESAQYPIVNVASYQFIALLTFTALWSMLMIILGIYDWISILHNDTETKL